MIWVVRTYTIHKTQIEINSPVQRTTDSTESRHGATKSNPHKFLAWSKSPFAWRCVVLACVPKCWRLPGFLSITNDGIMLAPRATCRSFYERTNILFANDHSAAISRSYPVSHIGRKHHHPLSCVAWTGTCEYTCLSEDTSSAVVCDSPFRPRCWLLQRESSFLSQPESKVARPKIGISDRIAANVHKNPRPIHKVSYRWYQKGLQVS